MEIDILEAKVKLTTLVQEVANGRRFTITIDGCPIADLIPSEAKKKHDIESVIENMRNIKKVRGVDKKTIQNWIIAGRRK